MNGRYEKFVGALRTAVLRSKATTDPALRDTIVTHAAFLAGCAPADKALPTELRAFVDRVAQRACEVSDEDIDALRRAGFSEDAIFEISICAAVGAGLGRLERGLAALQGAG